MQAIDIKQRLEDRKSSYPGSALRHYGCSVLMRAGKHATTATSIFS